MRVRTFCLMDRAKVSQYRLCEIIPTICGVNGTNLIQKTPNEKSRIQLNGILKRDRMRSYSQVVQKPNKMRSQTELKQTTPPKYISLRVTAKFWSIYEDQQRLLASQEDCKFEMGEFSMLMAVQVALQEPQNLQRMQVPAFVENLPNAHAELNAYSVLTLEDLICATFLTNAQDAIWTIVTALFGINRAFARQRMLEKMNLQAAKLKMKDTRFTNFDGSADPNNITTLQDLQKLVQGLLRHPEVQRVLERDIYQCRSVAEDGTPGTQYAWRGNRLLKKGFRGLLQNKESGVFVLSQRVVILQKSKGLLSDLKLVCQLQP